MLQGSRLAAVTAIADVFVWGRGLVGLVAGLQNELLAEEPS